jgi:nucleoside-diphosphate-sugar epimerase
MQTILLTGATGYLGSHLAKAFVCAGHRVAILIRKNSNLSRIRSLLPYVQVFNIEDGLDKPFHSLCKVHAVVHVATCYGRNGETPYEVFEANLVFPIRLLEVALNFGVESYLNTDTFFNTKNERNVCMSSYALSKHQFNEWGRSLGSAGLVKFINLRLEHLYGPLDGAQKFAMYIIRNCLNNVPEINLTLCEQTRDFVHVDDVVQAYVCILDKGSELGMGHHEFGIGSGLAVSVREFVNIVHRLTNSRSVLLFGALPHRKDEIVHSQANTSRLEECGWRCHMSLEQGLQKTIDVERLYETPD